MAREISQRSAWMNNATVVRLTLVFLFRAAFATPIQLKIVSMICTSCGVQIPESATIYKCRQCVSHHVCSPCALKEHNRASGVYHTLDLKVPTMKQPMPSQQISSTAMGNRARAESNTAVIFLVVIFFEEIVGTFCSAKQCGIEYLEQSFILCNKATRNTSLFVYKGAANVHLCEQRVLNNARRLLRSLPQIVDVRQRHHLQL